MKNTMKILGLSALALAVATPAFAESAPKKTHTVTEVVGYEETIVYTVPQKDAAFAQLDVNGDGVVTFNEFRNRTMVDNPYGIFAEMDTSGDKLIQIDEYRVYNPTKGNARSGSRFNFNNPKTVSDIKIIENKRMN